MKYLHEKQFLPIAMQVLAAGALKPKEAIEYLGRFPKIEIAFPKDRDRQS